MELTDPLVLSSEKITTITSNPRYAARIIRSRRRLPAVETTRSKIGFAGTSRQK